MFTDQSVKSVIKKSVVVVLSLGLLVWSVLAAPFAKLRHFKAGLDGLLVLARVVVDAMALPALHFD